MESCRHRTLVLVRAEAKVRCRTCHLSLSREELGSSHCPECYEARGERNYDFEEVAEAPDGGAAYVCEDCGVRVES